MRRQARFSGAAGMTAATGSDVPYDQPIVDASRRGSPHVRSSPNSVPNGREPLPACSSFNVVFVVRWVAALQATRSVFKHRPARSSAQYWWPVLA